MAEIDRNAVQGDCRSFCEFCEPWYDPKPLVETPKLIIRLVVKDDMYRYVQLLCKGLFGGWRESELIAIDRCPICGKEV